MLLNGDSQPATPILRAVDELHNLGVQGIGLSGRPGHACARGLLVQEGERHWYEAFASTRLEATRKLAFLFHGLLDG